MNKQRKQGISVDEVNTMRDYLIRECGLSSSEADEVLQIDTKRKLRSYRIKKREENKRKEKERKIAKIERDKRMVTLPQGSIMSKAQRDSLIVFMYKQQFDESWIAEVVGLSKKMIHYVLKEKGLK